MALNPRPNPFVVVSANTGSMIVNYLDRQTNQAGLTYGVGYQFLTQGRFEPEEIQRILALLNLRRQYFGDGVIMLDCGANIGAVTIPAGIEMTGWGKVISFEAQERIYYALAGNVAINMSKPSIQPSATLSAKNILIFLSSTTQYLLLLAA